MDTKECTIFLEIHTLYPREDTVMKKLTTEQVINVSGKVASVVIMGAGMAASVLIGKSLFAIKMNPILKFGGTYLISSLIGDYTSRKAGEAWNAGATYRAKMEALEKAMEEDSGDYNDLNKDIFMTAAKTLLDEMEKAAAAADEEEDEEEDRPNVHHSFYSPFGRENNNTKKEDVS